MILALAEAGGLAGALAKLADPWAKIFSHSKAVSACVTFLHLAPLVFAAGAAFTADRATLRSARAGATDRARQLREIAASHRMVLFGLSLSFVSGILLFLSDVETFWGSIYFYIKLALVGLLLVNGFVMTRTEKALESAGDDPALWGRMRTIALFSAALWLATVLAGVVLKEFA
ncbi:MAG: hypothetical protein ABI969_04310 [bacterium]